MLDTLKVPELGENVEAVEVVRVLVAVGDRVEKEQPLVEVETEKASVEIPATAAGVVTEVHASVGDRLTTDDPLVTLETGAADAPAGSSPVPATASVPVPVPDKRQAAASETAPVRDRDRRDTRPLAPTREAPAGPRGLIPAAPSVRRFAREVGVDLTRARGSGPRGRLTVDDVKREARERIAAATAVAPAAPAPALPDFSRYGEVAVEPMSKIRRLTAEAVARAATLIPQVTHHDLADVTELEELRARYAPRVAEAGGALTLTSFLVKLVATNLKLHPRLNASVDMAGGQVILKRYVHLGVAVDTEHGLLVPVIRDADRLSVTAIAVSLGDLATRARSRKLMPDELQGASFTISNLGGIGGTAFSPIVNWPEVAILGVSRARTQPVWNGTEFRPRLLLPLSLSYDHRVVDGAEAARFLRSLGEALEQPFLLALEG